VTERDDLPVEGTEDVDPLVDELRALFGGVPERVERGARAVYTWRTIDEELAELPAVSRDSLDRAAELAGVRTHGVRRRLSLEWSALAIEFEVVESAGERRLIGQIDPPTVADLQLEHAGGGTEGRSDDLGHFELAAPPRGPARLRCTPAGSSRGYRSEWILL
jgi:hypothetical protein